jgi:hypothetical protein
MGRNEAPHFEKQKLAESGRLVQVPPCPSTVLVGGLFLSTNLEAITKRPAQPSPSQTIRVTWPIFRPGRTAALP